MHRRRRPAAIQRQDLPSVRVAQCVSALAAAQTCCAAPPGSLDAAGPTLHALHAARIDIETGEVRARLFRTVTGGIAAGAEVNVGVAAAGVKGGIFTDIYFDLNDPDDDGRIRGYELAGNARLGIDYIFDTPEEMLPPALVTTSLRSRTSPVRSDHSVVQPGPAWWRYQGKPPM